MLQSAGAELTSQVATEHMLQDVHSRLYLTLCETMSVQALCDTWYTATCNAVAETHDVCSKKLLTRPCSCLFGQMLPKL